MRAYNPTTDANFIFSTWLKGLRFGNAYYESIPADTYFENYQKVIEKILAYPKTQVLIACFKDDPEIILAYAVKAGTTLHWVFTKPAWRKMGLAKLLVPTDTISTVSHVTKIGKALMPSGVSFDPFT